MTKDRLKPEVWLINRKLQTKNERKHETYAEHQFQTQCCRLAVLCCGTQCTLFVGGEREMWAEECLETSIGTIVESPKRAVHRRDKSWPKREQSCSGCTAEALKRTDTDVWALVSAHLTVIHLFRAISFRSRKRSQVLSESPPALIWSSKCVVLGLTVRSRDAHRDRSNPTWAIFYVANLNDLVIDAVLVRLKWKPNTINPLENFHILQVFLVIAI